MDRDALQRKLLAAGRLNRPSDHVPYTFEQRVMARIAGMKPLDASALWSRYFMCAALCSLVFLGCLALGAHFLPEENAVTASAPDVSQEMQQTLYAGVDSAATGDVEMP